MREYIESKITPFRIKDKQLFKVIDLTWKGDVCNILYKFSERENKLKLGEFKLVNNTLKYSRTLPTNPLNPVRYTTETNPSIAICSRRSVGLYRTNVTRLKPRYRINLKNVIDITINSGIIVLLRDMGGGRGVLEVYDRTKLLFDDKTPPNYTVDVYISDIKLANIGSSVLYISGLAGGYTMLNLLPTKYKVVKPVRDNLIKYKDWIVFPSSIHRVKEDIYIQLTIHKQGVLNVRYSLYAKVKSLIDSKLSIDNNESFILPHNEGVLLSVNEEIVRVIHPTYLSTFVREY